jgi:hypothetical protein
MGHLNMGHHDGQMVNLMMAPEYPVALLFQEALGFHFATVYAYLRKTRSAATPPDEREVQKKLLEIVGNRKDLMPGCFMVDQLVFTESMH